jgi:hypothetical protein
MFSRITPSALFPNAQYPVAATGKKVSSATP